MSSLWRFYMNFTLWPKFYICIIHMTILHHYLHHHHLVLITCTGHWGRVQHKNSSGMVYHYSLIFWVSRMVCVGCLFIVFLGFFCYFLHIRTILWVCKWFLESTTTVMTPAFMTTTITVMTPAFMTTTTTVMTPAFIFMMRHHLMPRRQEM